MIGIFKSENIKRGKRNGKLGVTYSIEEQALLQDMQDCGCQEKECRERHEEMTKEYPLDGILRKKIKENEELKAKLEDAKATAYAESVDSGMRERRLKRALWLARANRVLEKIAWFKLWNTSISTMNPEDGARQEYDKWKKALGKCRAMAEKFK